jgi:Helix-turn-helix domain
MLKCMSKKRRRRAGRPAPAKPGGRRAQLQSCAVSAPYFTLVPEMKDAYNHRLRLVHSARQRGIKPTARLFQTTVLTVRKWLRRYQRQGPSGLSGLSRAPHHQPGKTPLALEQQAVALRQ